MQDLLARLGVKPGKPERSSNAAPATPAKVILVPPIFEKDLYDRSRFASATAAYDLVLARPQLQRLFSQHVPDNLYKGAVFFSPPAEERLSLEAALAPGNGAHPAHLDAGAAQGQCAQE